MTDIDNKCRISVYLAIMLFLIPITTHSAIQIVPIEAYSAERDINHIKVLDSLSIITAENEFESASFYIKNSNNRPTTITIEITNLLSDKSSIASNQIDIRYVKEWYQSNGAWETVKQSQNDKFRPVLTRELLLKNPELIKVDNDQKINQILIGKKEKYYFNLSSNPHKFKDIEEVDADKFYLEDSVAPTPLTAAEGQTTQVWLTFKPSINNSPGIYHGMVLLKENGAILASHELTVEILPFKLDSPDQIYSIYYRGKLDKRGTISSESKSPIQLAAEFKDMVEHGVCCPTVYQRVVPKYHGTNKDSLKQLFANYLDIRQKSGISNNLIYYLGLQSGSQTTQREREALTIGLDRLTEALNAYNPSEIYIYGKEEVNDSGWLRQIPSWLDTKARGYKIFVAGSKDFFEYTKNAADLLIYYGQIERNAAHSAHRNDTKIFSYANPQVGVENPALYRNNYGFNLIDAGFDGVMDYSYQHSMGFIWNDFDHEIYRDHVFAYPTSNGVIDTLAWEAFREAVDDAKYYATAKNKLMKSDGERGAIYLKNWLSAKCADKTYTPDKIRSELISIIMKNR